MFGSNIYILLKFNAKNAHLSSSNWPRFVCAVYLEKLGSADAGRI